MLANAEPKRLRHQLLHVAGRLAFCARRAKLPPAARLAVASELIAAFEKLKALPAPVG